MKYPWYRLHLITYSASVVLASFLGMHTRFYNPPFAMLGWPLTNPSNSQCVTFVIGCDVAVAFVLLFARRSFLSRGYEPPAKRESVFNRYSWPQRRSALCLRL